MMDYEFRQRAPEDNEDEEVIANAGPPEAIAIHKAHTKYTPLSRSISPLFKTLV